MDVYKRGGDSLLGRYFPYRMHPLSVGELLRSRTPRREIPPPAKLASEAWGNLRAFGAFLSRLEGFRSENPAAVHLMKAVRLWTDLGFGKSSLQSKDRSPA